MLEINGRKLQLTNLDKLFWPEEGYTKHDLLRFYIDISPFLLPYLCDRPCSFQRFPDGIRGKSFYQKNIPASAPPWIQTFPVPSGKRIIHYPLVNNLETLVYMVNMACLEIHPWHSRTISIRRPDWGVVDLDPQEGVDFPAVVEAAAAVKAVMDELGLSGYPKTSGATGMQIYIPIKPYYTYDQIREIIGRICRQVNQKKPRLTTMERMVKKRGAKVYLDYLQNGWGKTINAPYTVRPVPGACVSTPLSWEEALSGKTVPCDFTIKTLPARLQSKGDLFLPALKKARIRPQRWGKDPSG
jgi:bifunctional non-homologous end joining protein LigD